MNTTFSLSSESLKFLFCGPKMIHVYYRKIRRDHKRTESMIHLVNIIFGLIMGLILGSTVLIDIPIYITKKFHFQNIQVLIIIGFIVTSSIILSSITYGISKGIIDVYNIRKYGVSNSQLAPLTDKEINHILLNCRNQIIITREGIMSLHGTLCRFIQAEPYKLERQKIKSAHWIFRRGSLIDACKSHPRVAEALSSCMTDTPISRDFIRRNLPIAHLMDHIEDGIRCDTINDRVHNIIDELKRITSEAILLQNMLEMGTEGISSSPVLRSRHNSTTDMTRFEEVQIDS